MRQMLFKQMDEKKQRERAQKSHNNEQANLWTQDKINYENEEKRLTTKIK